MFRVAEMTHRTVGELLGNRGPMTVDELVHWIAWDAESRSQIHDHR